MPTPTPAPEVIWAFLKEIFHRLKAKSPKFFNIITWLGVIAFLLTGLPAILAELGIVLPDNLKVLESKIIAWASGLVVFISKLTVIDPSELPFSGDTTTKKQ